MKIQTLNQHVHSQRRRKGVATVEFAVCLPLLILVVMGSIETSNAIFLSQGLKVTAYETAQIATAIGGTQTAATNRGQEVAKTFGLKSPTITISPAITSATPVNTPITVTVTADSNSNSIGFIDLFAGKTIKSTVTMVRL